MYVYYNNYCRTDLCIELHLTSDLGPHGSRGVYFDDQHCPTLHPLTIKTTHPQHTITVDSTCVILRHNGKIKIENEGLVWNPS